MLIIIEDCKVAVDGIHIKTFKAGDNVGLDDKKLCDLLLSAGHAKLAEAEAEAPKTTTRRKKSGDK